MKNYRIYIACIAWLVAMIVLPSEVVMLSIAGPMLTE